MEMQCVLSGPAGNRDQALGLLTARGFAAEPWHDPFEEKAGPTVAFVQAYKPRTSEAVPVVEADPERDADDLAEAQAVAEPAGFALRLHGHRSQPHQPDAVESLAATVEDLKAEIALLRKGLR